MYHGRFKNTHYQTGFDWGEMLRKHGNFIHEKHTFQITEDEKSLQCSVCQFMRNIIPKFVKPVSMQGYWFGIFWKSVEQRKKRY